jgi:hypothetical protein
MHFFSYILFYSFINTGGGGEPSFPLLPLTGVRTTFIQTAAVSRLIFQTAPRHEAIRFQTYSVRIPARAQVILPVGLSWVFSVLQLKSEPG